MFGAGDRQVSNNSCLSQRG